MKIVTYLLGAMLAAALGAAALFYFMTFQPMQADYEQIKPAMPNLEKASAELKRYKKKEAEETAWVGPALAVVNAGLSDEIKTGSAEVVGTGSGIVVNIAEKLLYTPGSVTFDKDSTQFRLKLAGLLLSPELKGKQVTLINTTSAVPSQGKGRKRTPPKEARTLAAERSVALAKFLEQNKVEQQALVAAASSSLVPDTGFKIKDHKTAIVIGNAPAPAPAAAPIQQKTAAPAPATKPSVTTHPSSTAPPMAPQAVPSKPVEPKGQ